MVFHISKVILQFWEKVKILTLSVCSWNMVYAPGLWCMLLGHNTCPWDMMYALRSLGIQIHGVTTWCMPRCSSNGAERHQTEPNVNVYIRVGTIEKIYARIYLTNKSNLYFQEIIKKSPQRTNFLRIKIIKWHFFGKTVTWTIKVALQNYNKSSTIVKIYKKKRNWS